MNWKKREGERREGNIFDKGKKFIYLFVYDWENMNYLLIIEYDKFENN